MEPLRFHDSAVGTSKFEKANAAVAGVASVIAAIASLFEIRMMSRYRRVFTEQG